MRVSDRERERATHRPDGLRVMRQAWSSLLFLHWEVPVDAIARMLPPGLEVDTFDGKAYIGLIPFTMSGVRPVGLPAVPWLSKFHEVNVRTYVHCKERNPGVWFFSLDAANPVGVWLARTFFHLPYWWARMRMQESPSGGGSILYESARRDERYPGSCRIRYRPTGVPAPAEAGSLAYFLAERYILYAAARGGLRLGRVHHRPYPLQGAEVQELDEDLVAASGIRRPDGPPLIHYASGVDVDVFGLEKADPSSR
jgi:uncharacterized protein YqjF (DUF2071 family)